MNLKGHCFVDSDEVIQNVTKQLKDLSKNGLQKFFEQLYERWNRYVDEGGGKGHPGDGSTLPPAGYHPPTFLHQSRRGVGTPLHVLQRLSAVFPGTVRRYPVLLPQLRGTFFNFQYGCNHTSNPFTFLKNYTISVLICTRAFGDEPRNFEPWPSGVDDIRAGTPSPNYHTTPTGGRLSSRQT
ncbi:hypothetical protein TNCV_4273411 [Trichonephila clavipes]|nr:hypothetical protein TNCV_4273411 [Trichonephila clavipes]